MKTLTFCYALASLLVLLASVGCADGGVRQLESLSISPAATSANGAAVQFTATGHWSTAPITETPMNATWGACISDGATSDVTVSNTGLAACTSTAKGTYTVFAWDFASNGGPVCNVITACGGGCGRVVGTAQLTCP